MESSYHEKKRERREKIILEPVSKQALITDFSYLDNVADVPQVYG